MSLDTTYLSASDGTGSASLMHVTSPRLTGATTLAVDTVTGVPTKFIATSGTLLASGFIDPATITEFYGHVDTGNLIIDGFCPGSTDAGNSAGQVVVIKPNTNSMNLIANFIAGIKTTVLGYVYPVGSIYINATNSANPSTVLGFGTWVAFGAGRVPVGFSSGETEFNASEKTGGEKTHALTAAELAGHTHSFSATTSSDGVHHHDLFVNIFNTFASGGGSVVPQNNPSFSTSTSWMTDTGAHTHSVSGTTGSTGSGTGHNNLQPYITVYMWKRTA